MTAPDRKKIGSPRSARPTAGVLAGAAAAIGNPDLTTRTSNTAFSSRIFLIDSAVSFASALSGETVWRRQQHRPVFGASPAQSERQDGKSRPHHEAAAPQIQPTVRRSRLAPSSRKAVVRRNAGCFARRLVVGGAPISSASPRLEAQRSFTNPTDPRWCRDAGEPFSQCQRLFSIVDGVGRNRRINPEIRPRLWVAASNGRKVDDGKASHGAFGLPWGPKSGQLDSAVQLPS